MKKIMISFFVVLIVCLIVVVVLYKKSRLTLISLMEDVDVYQSIELKDLVDVNIINNYKIDTSIVGKKEIEVKYKNKIFTYTDFIDINIVDKESPIVLVKDITLEKGSKVDLVNRFLCGDNYDVKPNCYIEGNYDLDEIGIYDLKYIAIDSSNNKTEKNFKLSIIDKFPESKPNDSFIDFKDIVSQHKTDNTSIGIDVSKWQGVIDFEEVKKQGCEFVIIKAGGSYFDGSLYEDPNFIVNIENALKNNLEVGVYFYSNSNSIDQSKKEIDFLLNLIKDYDVEYVAFDWENFNDFNSYNINLHSLNEMANVFLGEASENGYNPLLYSSKYYLENIWNISSDIWVAQYSDINTYEGDYVIWQQCSDGKIEGINAYVDIDIMYK